MNKKVALLANGWNGENLDFFIKGFQEYFKDHNVDLFLFTSHMLSGQSPKMRGAEDSIYHLPDFSFFDAVVLFSAGMNSNDGILELIEKCKKADVPVILQGGDLGDVSSVTIDNIIGMKNLCDHIIEKHGVSDVVYIAGDVENGDSNLRMQVLKESLEAHGHELKAENIIYACWSTRMIRDYLTATFTVGKKKLPDAFVCANDQMALSLLSFLEQMGVRVPEDVIVTGFDNLSPGRAFYPSLATVDQQYEEQGAKCAEVVAESLDNKGLVRKVIVPTILSPGESCGCSDCKGETELRKQIGRNRWIEQFFNEVLQGRKKHMDICIMSNKRYEHIHRSINEDLLRTVGMETGDFHIYVNPQYKELKYTHQREREFTGPYYEPVLEVVAARTNGVILEGSTVDPKTLFLGYDGNEKGKTYAFLPLIIGEEVFGYMVMGYSERAFEKKVLLEFSNSLRTTFEQYQRKIDDYNREIRIKEQDKAFLQQTAEALASAIDANDSYTHGHSARVAKYAKKIAMLAGLSPEDCDEIYLAGLLHDVGKLGIDNSIINKKGRLTDEEFAAIKQHPVYGDAILAKIQMSPYLSIGARHHHERYDGKGYPDRLKGDEIPQIARIIAVADAYDAMTSKRSYRDIIPQMQVREELVEGLGTQFDPEYAKIMIHLLDLDEEYLMKENRKEEIFTIDSIYRFDTYLTSVTAGLRITDYPVTIHMQYASSEPGGIPTLLFYDSTDAKYHASESSLAKDTDFVEYGRFCLDGKAVKGYARELRQNTSDGTAAGKSDENCSALVQLVKQKDHILVKISTKERTDELILALHDASRYLYLALTGEHCSLNILSIAVADEPVAENYIPRIVDKISYIDGPAGDIPNIQIDGWRSASSEVLEITDDMSIRFHTRSLPSSNRAWHCPILCLFTSDDGKIGGPNYKEVALIRLEGEVWDEVGDVTNTTTVTKDESFENWNIWKNKNKAGTDCTSTIHHEGEFINVQVEDGGLVTVNQTKLPNKVEKIYCFFTGDQCAITDIHITK